MDFGFSEEQDLLRAQARQFLDERCPLSVVRTCAATPLGYSTEHWKQIAELGWTGIAIDEAYGGAGLGWLDLVILLEEAGRSLFPAPLMSTALVGAIVQEAGSPEQKSRWLPGIASGTLVGTLALLDLDAPESGSVQLEARPEALRLMLSGEKPFVHDAHAADLFVVGFRQAGQLRLAVLERDRPGLEAEVFSMLDTTKRQGRVRLSDVAVRESDILEGADEAALSRLLARAAIAVSAEILGAASEAHRITTDFARERVQFGEPIGRFQGVKHPLADMYVDLESVRSLVYYAAWALDGAPEEVERVAAMAKAYAGETFARIGIDAVQLHGAVGYTDEYDVQLFLKRSKWARPAFGDPDFHYERVARLGGL